MEILKRGTKPTDRTHTGKCSNCGTKVRFKRSEAKFIPAVRAGDDDALTVNCPVCKMGIWIGL